MSAVVFQRLSSRTSGESVVILPGGPGPDPGYLAPLLLELGDSFVVWVGRYPDELGAMTLGSLKDAIRAALGPAGGHLVGHSLGALLALACGPELRLLSLAALSPLPTDEELLLDMAERSASRLELLDLAGALRLRSAQRPGEAASALELEHFAQATLPLFAREAAWLTSAYHRIDPLGLMRFLEEHLAWDWPGQLASLRAPSMLLWGEHDVIPPLHLEAIRDRLRGPRALSVRDAGHMAPVEQPAAVASELMRFWAESAPERPAVRPGAHGPVSISSR